MLHRKIVDLSTGEVTEIAQTAYRGADGELLVLDSSEKAPRGFTAITHEELALESKE